MSRSAFYVLLSFVWSFHTGFSSEALGNGNALPLELQKKSTLFVNVQVIDGTGSLAFPAKVRLQGSQISEIGELSPQPGEKVVDGKGLVLSPGFIDTHSHYDRALKNRNMAGALSQGITTIVIGQDGVSFPASSLSRQLKSYPVAVNVVPFTGHGSLRSKVMRGDYKRRATHQEVESMAKLLIEDLNNGSFGLSSGLEYDPGIYAATEELFALGKHLKEYQGIYISHIRSEDRTFWEAIEEGILIAKNSQVPFHISHLKLSMRSLWGQHKKLFQELESTQRNGIRISADVYPYEAWQSNLKVFFPNRDFENRKTAEFALTELTQPHHLTLTYFPPEPPIEGKTLAQIAALRRLDPVSTLLQLVKQSLGHSTGIIAKAMRHSDIIQLLRWTNANVCSDGAPNSSHPRGKGAFPRVLAKYVREEQAFTLPEAIHKMTELAAKNMGIPFRGKIQEGYYADLILFDPKSIQDHASFEQPHLYSTGIHSVWVNGQEVFSKNSPTGVNSGVFLRKNHVTQ